MILSSEETVQRLILVIENDLAHVDLIERVFDTASLQRQIVAVSNGMQALDFLKRREDYVDASRPDLILLNLDLPDQSGIELLRELKTDPRLRRIPIVILTLSAREEDISRAYRLQGNCYVVKSTDSAKLTQIIRRIEEFWLGIVTLPLE